ncbi:type II secretion system F family protein [Paenibacillus sp. strain BS8-2]
MTNSLTMALGAAFLLWSIAMFLFWSFGMKRLRTREKLLLIERGRKRRNSGLRESFKRRLLYWAHRFAIVGQRFPYFINKKDIMRKLELAGYPEGLDLNSFYGLRFVSFVGVSLGAILLQSLGFINSPIQLLLMAFGLFVPVVWIRLAASARQEQISADLPDFMDMMSVTLQAGIPLEPAIKQIVGGMEGPLADELNRFIQETDMGLSREESFTRLMKRNNSQELETLVTALLQGSKLGVPIANTFRSLSEDIRSSRINKIKEKAAKAGPKVTLITTFCILPAVLLLVVGLLVLNFIYNPAGMGIQDGFGF